MTETARHRLQTFLRCSAASGRIWAATVYEDCTVDAVLNRRHRRAAGHSGWSDYVTAICIAAVAVIGLLAGGC
jgi:hypothetical protein